MKCPPNCPECGSLMTLNVPTDTSAFWLCEFDQYTKSYERKYLRIPRDADFPTLTLPTNFQDYAFAYYLGAKELWEKTGKGQHSGVPYPDNLVYPILFLVHHFLELELKSGIELTYSIGNMTGELTEEQGWRSHDLNYLLALLKENLHTLIGIPEGRPSEPTCDLIEDMANFGMLGESLRYPIVTVKKKTREKVLGGTWPDGLIPDVQAVIAAADEAWSDFGGLISCLMNCEEILIEERLQQL